MDGAAIQPIKDGEAISLSDAIAQENVDTSTHRLSSGSPGVDHVLGGGIPIGVAILLVSPPGGGKSTLLIETLRKLAMARVSVLYICTEESTRQMGRRYKRLGKFPPRLVVVHQKDIEDILEEIRRRRPKIVAVDSLHDIEGVCDDNGAFYSSGSATSVLLAAKQIRRCAGELDLTSFLVAHVTKDGDIAGTNTVQHSLDGTLYLNGQQKTIDGRLIIVGVERTLRCDGKNRFGGTGGVARFQMHPDGLHDLGPWFDSHPPWAARRDNDEGAG